MVGSWLTALLVVGLQIHQCPLLGLGRVRVPGPQQGHGVEGPVILPFSSLGFWQFLTVWPHPLPLYSLGLAAQDTGIHLDKLLTPKHIHLLNV